jgi:hypothetical protein
MPNFEHWMSLLAGKLPYAGSILASADCVAARFDAVLQHDNRLTR